MNPQTKEQFRILVKNYGTRTKWGLFITLIYLMVQAISSYYTYDLIIKNTLTVQEQAKKVHNEISYFNHFQLKFLNSNYAQKFLAHENNILEYGEALISFQEPAPLVNTSGAIATDPYKTPREERKDFFATRLEN